MKPEFEGRGGGYGRYQGLTLAEIQALFDTCTGDPSMRSISAVLRITREQLDARGQLGIYPVFAWIAAFACSTGLIMKVATWPTSSDLGAKIALGSGSILVILIGSTIPARNQRKVNLAQEREIREMAAQAISTMLESGPTLKPLTIEQETTVKILIRKTSAGDRLRVLLAVEG